MRHVRSFMLSLVLAPLIWALTGLGLLVQDGGAPAMAADQARQVWLGAFVAAGVLVAVLAVARLSPLGPALAGLGFLGAVAYAPSLRLVVPVLPNGFEEALLLPADGFAIVLGIPLLATALSGRRWRRATSPPLLYATTPATPAPTLVSPPAPTLVSPPPTLVSPSPTLISPSPTLISPQSPTYGAPVASTYSRPAVTYAAPTTLAVPDDPWPPWWHPQAADGSPAPDAAPEYEVAADTGPTSPWARPAGPSVDDKTDDLSEALLPLRNGSPRPAG